MHNATGTHGHMSHMPFTNVQIHTPTCKHVCTDQTCHTCVHYADISPPRAYIYSHTIHMHTYMYRTYIHTKHTCHSFIHCTYAHLHHTTYIMNHRCIHNKHIYSIAIQCSHIIHIKNMHTQVTCIHIPHTIRYMQAHTTYTANAHTNI